MKILVTAGPTRERIDDVRFITSASTGRMGYAVAAAALKHGHDADLITGPTNLSPPDGAVTANVTTALQMRDAVLERVDETNVLVMTAAVSDWTLREPFDGKIKKTREPLSIDLLPNPDILAEATHRNPDMLAVAFALEVGMDVESALKKMSEKGAHFVVLNSVEAMGAEEADFAVYPARGADEPVIAGRYTKEDLAEALVGLIERNKSS